MPRTESLSSLTNLQNNESFDQNYGPNRLSPREIVIVGVHPRDAHIILNRVHQLRESSDSNEDMYGGSKKKNLQKEKLK